MPLPLACSSSGFANRCPSSAIPIIPTATQPCLTKRSILVQVAASSPAYQTKCTVSEPSPSARINDSSIKFSASQRNSATSWGVGRIFL